MFSSFDSSGGQHQDNVVRAASEVELSSLLLSQLEEKKQQDDDGPELMTRGSTVTSLSASGSDEDEEEENADDSHTYHYSDDSSHDKKRQKSKEKTSLLVKTRGGATTIESTKTVSSPPRGGAKDNKSSSKASMTSSVFNLVNNVAGAGILALSAGMTGGTGWIPSILLCVLLGILSSHSFKIIGDACEITGEADFKGLWARTIGPQTTYMVDSIIAFMCIAVSIIYSGILGDVFTPFVQQVLPNLGRTSVILILTGVLLLPLSLIKDLSALAFTSILGFCAIAYTVVFIVIRALDGSYTLGSGRFVQLVAEEPAAAAAASLLEAMPSFEKSSLWGFGFTSLVLVSNLGLAFIAHYNAPVFYRQLQDTNSQRFGRMVDISFTILVALYAITMTAGYSTFGDVCRGNLLLNYHPHDVLGTFGRLATGFSVLFGFPLVMCGARESLIGAASSCGWDGLQHYHFGLVAGMLSFVTAIAISVDDVSLVVGLTGAAMGAFIVYICPAILYTKAVKIIKGELSTDYSKAKKSLLLVPFGLFVGSLGVYMTIKEAME